jgi:lipoprotein-anchoring transpeptidase ErfK/SrfK
MRKVLYQLYEECIVFSRRSLIFGLGAMGAALSSSVANAGSILELFGSPQPVIIRKSRRIPDPISTKKRAAKKASAKIAKSSTKKKKVRAAKPFKIDPRFEPQEVQFSNGYKTGTIVVNSDERFLYLVTGSDTARRYGVAIGKEGLGWRGTAVIKAKAEWPSWTPTPDMIKRSPKQYARYKDGMPGGPSNPLGARAMYLYQGKRDTSIRIHGTTQPWSIGQAASNGCFRMVNEHVIDLYGRVRTGTTVVVL